MRLFTIAVPLLRSVFARGGLASEGFDDVLKMTRAGVGEELLMTYVEQSAVSYDLSTDEIILLKDLGVSEKIIVAMLSKGKTIRAEEPATPPVEPIVQALPPEPQHQAEPDADPAPVYQAKAPRPLATTGDLIISAPVVHTSAVVMAPPSEGFNITFFYEALTP